MKNTNRAIFIYGAILGILMGWIGSTLLRTTKPDDTKSEKSDISIVQDGHKESDSEDQIRHLEVRNTALSLKVSDLEATLEKYQQEKEEETEARNRDKEQVIASRLKDYKALFELTVDQAYLIGEWEWEMALHWKEFHAGKRTADDPIPYFEDKVRGILTPEQLEIYNAHLEEKNHRSAEVVAQMRLSAYPSNLELSEEQKDSLYENLYYMHHKSTSGDYEEILDTYRNDRGYDISAAFLMIAAEGVLSEDQMNELKKTFAP